MNFAHDTRRALADAAALVNTREDGDQLAERAGLDSFLDNHPYTGRVDGDTAELAAVRTMRTEIASFWEADSTEDVAALCNALLAQARARPYVTRHDEWDWHLHVTEPQAPLADRMAAEYAMAFVDLLRVGDLDRLRTCGAPDCQAVLVDLSRNRSKRYCDVGNCGNRQHVAAYRARHADR